MVGFFFFNLISKIQLKQKTKTKKYFENNREFNKIYLNLVEKLRAKTRSKRKLKMTQFNNLKQKLGNYFVDCLTKKRKFNLEKN